MAVIKKDGGNMALPIAISRGNPIPLDTTAVWYNKTDMENYAKTGATAYVGQVLTFVDETNKKAEAYLISSVEGTLIKLASTTASGDLARDVAALQSTVAGHTTQLNSLNNNLGTIQTLAESKVASVTAADKSITVGGTATEPTVKVAVSAATGNALSLESDGLKVTIPAAAKYSIEKAGTAEAGYSATYYLTKDGTNVGTAINIPKDMVVSDGYIQTFNVGEFPEGSGITEAGTYIVLVLANNSNKKIYINVGSLIEYVTSGSKATDAVVINIDPSTHKVTANLTDGKITKAKLESTVQTSLGKADTALQKNNITKGSTKGTIAVGGTDVSVNGLKSAAYTDSDDYDMAGAAAEVLGTSSDSVNGVNPKVTVHSVYNYAQNIEGSLGGLTNIVNEVSDKANAAVVANNAITGGTHTKITYDAKGLVTGGADLTASDIPALGISKITGLQDALNSKQDDVAFDGGYNAGTNKAATVSTVNTAVEGLIGTAKDTKDSNTIKGAKKYADDIASTAASNLNNAISSIDLTTSLLRGQIDTLNGDATTNGSVKKTATDIVTTKINALDVNDTAVSGKFVTAVSETDGKITVSRATLKISDLPNKIPQDKIEDLSLALASKQNALSFEGAPSANNKVVTKSAMDSAISTATAGLTGAMHFVGNSTSDPLGASGPTIAGHIGAFKSGDVCTHNNKEFVYDGTSWRELGNEGSYIVQGTKFTDTDIAAKANIAQSKIAGLTDDIAAAKKLAVIYDEFSQGPISSSTPDGKNTTLRYAKEYVGGSECAGGIVAVSPNKDNGIKIASTGEITVANITTDIIKNGANTLILNGGGAAL